MAIANAVTFLSYFTICATLFYLVRHTRRVMAREWAYFGIGFALFIVACGSTHLMEVITTWISVFWIDAWANIVTALLSGYVAVQFMRRVRTISGGINDYADRLQRSETDRARAEENLLAARKLEEWNRMSAAVTHEISNPLSSIRDIMYLVRNSSDVPKDIVQLANQTEQELDYVVALVRSTLGFFRNDGPSPSISQNTDLIASIESVKFLLAAMLRQRSVELIVQATGDCTVSANPVEVRQVLLNLIRNACEATTSGKPITIHLNGREHEVVIRIEDQGTGIPATLLPHLFQFGSSSKGAGGSGIGLWAVQQIVSRNKGSISAESTEGRGSTFTVVWPRKCGLPIAV
jgi:signal transduction histidine kinase